MRAIDADALKEKFPAAKDWRNPNEALVHKTGIWAEIDAAPTISDWIPCEERPPEKSGAYLVSSINNGIRVGRFVKFNDKDEGKWTYGTILAWMPIPVPYVKEEE